MSSVSSSTNAASGLNINNSGLPIDDIIAKLIAVESQPIKLMQQQQATIKQQQSAYSTAQSRVNDMLVSLKKLTTRNVDGTSIFDNMTGTSSNTAIATATVTGKASPQTISLEVKSLPSKTKATSTNLVGKFDGTTTVDQLNITAGNFTVFVNGAAHSYTVNAGDSMQTILDNINNDASIPEITSASIVNGKITFGYSGAPTTKIAFGTGGDTSNFLAMTHLNTAVDDGNGTIAASQINTTIDLTKAVSTAAANLSTAVTDGTFTINGVSFDTTGKSVNDIIDAINASSAGVRASINLGTNKFELTANSTGSTLISLGDTSNGGGSSNFLTAMGLIDGGTGSITNSQTAGKNTEFVLNGATMYSTSTTVDETVTGLSGVTLNLASAQPGTTVSINIQKDTASPKTAIQDVVTKYNSAVSYIDQITNAQNKAVLAGQTRLTSLRNQLRSMFTTAVGGLAGKAYDSLQTIGISTGPSAGGTASPTLTFDTSKFDTALAADPNTVKQLFIAQDLGGAQNGTAKDDNFDGIFTQLSHVLSDTTYVDGNGNTGFGALYNGPDDNSKGLFYSYQSTAAKRISNLDDSIQRAQDRIDKREEALRKQYTAMDQMIGQYQSQGSALANLISQMSANK